ncbi:flagellar basal body P-ring formation protein FlgA [Roseomonas terrae]|uniref:Flagellar basal body P-ring formation protein FlgA n=1 Tax=Neoroseomonas terrae TaxID=424799 RepID=A0ABS5EEE3_9PROT|nr:flagellar basal body P-ring formation chaperone FlgA [Neoroseomonas terrae]MBR0649340.1 flagellar basal body P-ring formation protein FlgA [Neoroseomonas terrae]
MRRRAFALLVLAALPARAQGLPPAPRPLVVAEDAALRLGDLFENAGEASAAVIGAAPAPGRRMTLDAAQLSMIARRYGLAWRPLSGEERSIVERPGRPLPREEIESLLRDELVRLGMDPEAELELPGFVPPMVPLGVLPQTVLDAVHFDVATRRFAATLVIAAEGMAGFRARLAGRALATVPVVVATRRLSVGDIVGPEDLREIRQRAERVRPGAAQRAEDVVGRQLRRPIAANLPYVLVDLTAPTVIAKNQMVLMLLDGPGLTLTAQGRALEAAARGERIPVMNLVSRSIVEAEAIGPGRVRVLLGAVPLQIARR